MAKVLVGSANWRGISDYVQWRDTPPGGSARLPSPAAAECDNCSLAPADRPSCRAEVTCREAHCTPPYAPRGAPAFPPPRSPRATRHAPGARTRVRRAPGNGPRFCARRARSTVGFGLRGIERCCQWLCCRGPLISISTDGSRNTAPRPSGRRSWRLLHRLKFRCICGPMPASLRARRSMAGLTRHCRCMCPPSSWIRIAFSQQTQERLIVASAGRYGGARVRPIRDQPQRRQALEGCRRGRSSAIPRSQRARASLSVSTSSELDHNRYSPLSGPPASRPRP